MGVSPLTTKLTFTVNVPTKVHVTAQLVCAIASLDTKVRVALVPLAQCAPAPPAQTLSNTPLKLPTLFKVSSGAHSVKPPQTKLTKRSSTPCVCQPLFTTPSRLLMSLETNTFHLCFLSSTSRCVSTNFAPLCPTSPHKV